MITIPDEADIDGSDGPGHRDAATRPRRRRLRLVLVVLVVLVVAAVTLALTKPLGFDIAHPFRSRHHASSSSRTEAAAATAPVARRTLTEQTSVNGTLGYAGSPSVLGQLPGTVTWLPSTGSVIREGHRLYEVDGKPVVLLYGSVPFYRDLAEGKTAADVSGADVRQLNAALVRLGYADGLGLDRTSDEFSWATRVAIQRMQKALGLTQTGKLSRGQVVFQPEALRVTTVAARLGAPATGQILTGTTTRRAIAVQLDVAEQAEVKVGDAVTITLPNGTSTPGRIDSVGSVATAGSGSESATVPVVVTPTKPADTGSWDQAPVQVAITTGTVRNATVVPVTALLALAGGGYAVEVVPSSGARRLVPVDLGAFDDRQGLVQVTGTGLAPGTRVVVPAT